MARSSLHMAKQHESEEQGTENKHPPPNASCVHTDKPGLSQKGQAGASTSQGRVPPTVATASL